MATPKSAKDLVADLVVLYAPTILEAERSQSLWHRGQAAVVVRAVMLAYDFDRDEAEEFVKILVREV